MPQSSPRSGYTLPVFACAAAIAALRWLNDATPCTTVPVELIDPPTQVQIPIEQVAPLRPGMALAITRSDPGDNLDLTRHTPVWALVEWADPAQTVAIEILGGEGVGVDRNRQDQAAIYAYAHQLMQTNLQRWLPPAARIRVTLILPEGKVLAQRTSNAAFGVVEGLSLLGTTGLSQPLSSPDQLDQFRTDLRHQAQHSTALVFCVGENGLDLAHTLGIPQQLRLKTANWLGPLLVEAGQYNLSAVLLLGYHGKLIKLAGGIFHTHHHLADARQEILTAHGAQLGLPHPDLHHLFHCQTTEAGLAYLRDLDAQFGEQWVQRVYGSITAAIDRRSQAYIRTHSDRTLQVGSALFDRSRTLFALSETGQILLDQLRRNP